MSAQDLSNRIKKRFVHLKKWAKRESITCFRLYERDLADYPVIVDWIDGDAVVWMYDRKKDETDDQKDAFLTLVSDAVKEALALSDGRLHIKSRRRQKGVDAQYEKLAKLKSQKIIKEGGLKFEVNLTDYLDTGLFLDHRQTRALCKDLAKGKRFLNLFSYTGSFTCYALAGGAISTTTVDLSSSYTDWTARNLQLNGFVQRGADRLLAENCLSFLKNEVSQNRYDLIVCDPPTFSNSKRMKTTFSINEDYIDLIKMCVLLLAPGGTLLFSTNSRSFKLDETLLPKGVTVENISHKTIPPDFRNKKIHHCWRLDKL